MSMFRKLRELFQRLTTSPVRIDIDVPFASKDQVKRLGARWDSVRRTWYIDSSYRLNLFARWIPNSSEYERVYLDVSYEDKNQVRLMGAQWDAKQRSWYVPSGIEVAPFARWLGKFYPSPMDIYHEMSSEQARYYLLREDGGLSVGIYLDDLKEAQELASSALEDESVVELRDNATHEVWRGADILKL